MFSKKSICQALTLMTANSLKSCAHVVMQWMSARGLTIQTTVTTRVGPENGQISLNVKVRWIAKEKISKIKFKLLSLAICSGADITGRTIKTVCELNGNVVPCNQQHIVGTEAFIKCGPYYDMPTDASHLSKKLTCLSSGSWDKLALRCEPRCGRITQVIMLVDLLSHTFQKLISAFNCLCN